MRLVQLSRHNIAFPSPEGALREPNGLLALGGDLSPARLLMAYQRGIFPWFSPGDPILWWSPDPRAVLWPTQFHLSRSMKRFHAKSPYRVTLNHAFGQVIEGVCGRPS
ncbi:leucyl/phenylalanyl-tRNA--protein transferase [Enterobacter cloacae]|uniref:Leucyl/phenylalanyl-tRNA--protein transferase n=1 Tax=Enterobacter cloacae TaxID=550 RepID=A0A377M3D7_ENTCL|nr:leucyl/phenylalanyl-tRNA--protein transferase [Enterobacter cloacae]